MFQAFFVRKKIQQYLPYFNLSPNDKPLSTFDAISCELASMFLRYLFDIDRRNPEGNPNKQRTKCAGNVNETKAYPY